MTFARHSGGIIILISFVIALMIMMMPLPGSLAMYRPEIVTMLLIYWCMALPNRVGVGVGWIAGLMLDVVQGALLGQHAFALAVVAWVTLKLYQRIRVYPAWQQALAVLLLIVLSQMIVLWVQGIIGRSPKTWMYWLPSITSMLLWPWLYLVMHNIRRAYKVS